MIIPGNPDTKGFLIVEVLIAIMILAVVFVAFMSAMARVLEVSSRAVRVTDSISRYEPFFFDIENGLRPDVAGYGGDGDLSEDCHYHIEAEGRREFAGLLKSRFSWKTGKEFLDLEIFVSKGPAQ